MLFKAYLIALIIAGKKTQTRRRGEKQRFKVGHVYRAKAHYYDKTGPQIRITRAWRQRLSEITPAEAVAEGFLTPLEFVAAWVSINGVYDLREEVWAYEFELVREAT